MCIVRRILLATRTSVWLSAWVLSCGAANCSPSTSSTTQIDHELSKSAKVRDTSGQSDSNAINRLVGKPASGYAGNLGTHRVLVKLALDNAWKMARPPKRRVSVTGRFTLNKEGKVVAYEVLQSSSDKKIDKRVLDTVMSAQFPPLPDWYTGPGVPYKFTLSGEPQD